MEEIEVPTDAVQERIHEEAHHARDVWVSRVALSAALLAVFAAVAALMAGHHSNEAMMDQIRASDQWSYYQAKGIKAAIQASRVELLEGFGKPVPGEDRKKVESYKKDQEGISEQAREHEKAAQRHLRSHQVLARSVTMFQIAIALSAIAVLTRRRPMWYVSLAFGGAGLAFFTQGLF